MQRLQSVQNFVLGGARIPIRLLVRQVMLKTLVTFLRLEGIVNCAVLSLSRFLQWTLNQGLKAVKGGNATIAPNGTIPMVECAHLDVRNAAMRSVHVPIWR